MLLNICSTSVTLSEENRLKGQFIPKLIVPRQVWNDIRKQKYYEECLIVIGDQNNTKHHTINLSSISNTCLEWLEGD